jgi:hypothetical protein
MVINPTLDLAWILSCGEVKGLIQFHGAYDTGSFFTHIYGQIHGINAFVDTNMNKNVLNTKF